MTETQPIVDTPRLEFAVWWGVAAGPVAWAFDLGFSYAVAPHACSTGHFYVLHIISLICFIVALTGFVLAFGTQRQVSAQLAGLTRQRSTAVPAAKPAVGEA